MFLSQQNIWKSVAMSFRKNRHENETRLKSVANKALAIDEARQMGKTRFILTSGHKKTCKSKDLQVSIRKGSG